MAELTMVEDSIYKYPYKRSKSNRYCTFVIVVDGQNRAVDGFRVPSVHNSREHSEFVNQLIEERILGKIPEAYWLINTFREDNRRELARHYPGLRLTKAVALPLIEP